MFNQLSPQIREQIATDMLKGIHRSEVIFKAADKLTSEGQPMLEAYRAIKDYTDCFLTVIA